MTLEANVEMSKEAKEAFQLLLQQYPATEKHFWHCIRKLVEEITPNHKASIPAPMKMTDEEARQFGQREIGFGKHRGTKIDDISIGYLLFLVDGNDFNKNLKRYLNSDRVSREIEMEVR